MTSPSVVAWAAHDRKAAKGVKEVAVISQLYADKTLVRDPLIGEEKGPLRPQKAVG